MHQQELTRENDLGVKERLLQAGIDLFAEKGYVGTSVREIVERAGVTKPVLYYYFESKEGLLVAILDWAREQQEAILIKALQMRGKTLDRLIFLYRRIYEGVMENHGLFKLIHDMIFGPTRGALPFDIDSFHRSMVDAIKEIYVDGLKKGEVMETKPDEVAFLVQGLFDFCFHIAFLHPEKSDPQRPERLLRLAFQGLGQANKTAS